MLPVLTIGSLHIATYPLLYSLSFLVGGCLALWRLERLPGDPRLHRTVLVVTVAAILAGLFLPSLLETRLESLLTGQPPGPVVIRVYYGLGLGLLAAFIYSHLHRLNLLEALDRGIPAFALGFSIARLGCLAAGCCGGAVTTSALGLYLPDQYGNWAVRFPTQIWSGLFEALLFVGLLRFSAWQNNHLADQHVPAWLVREGTLTCLYLLLFCLERFVLEFLRQDYIPIWGPFSLPHLLMLAGMTLVLAFLFRLNLRQALPVD